MEKQKKRKPRYRRLVLRLELNVINIKKVQFANETSIQSGVLSVDPEELKRLLKEDTRLGEIDVELANPGEKCRIARIIDVVEPRAKVGNDVVDFPGAVGSQGIVGHGGTCVLRGAAVLTSDAFPVSGPPGVRAAGGLVDMWGPGAEVGQYGKTCNLVIVPSPSAGISQPEYQVALKIAGLKAAVYLARAGVDMGPDSVEVYELPPLPEPDENSKGLPRIAYIMQLFSNQFLAVPDDPVFYGDNLERLLPTIVHPNEIIDGAVTAPCRNMGYDTYTVQNHPMVMELYRNHGKSLYFAGVIVNNAPNNGPTIDRTANIAANLTKWTLGADGAVLTKTGGGAPNITLAETASRCEQLGVRTVIVVPSAGGDASTLTMKPSTLFNDVPGVDAMVSLGGGSAASPNLNLPAAERVIGMGGPQFAGEMVRPATQIKGTSDQIGYSSLKIVQY